MADEYNPVVKLYYDELFGALDFYLSDIAPGDETLRYAEPVALKRQGLAMSAEFVGDQSPELADLFETTSVTERYNYLVHRFSDEYQGGMERIHAELTGKAEESLARLRSHEGAMPSSWENIKNFGGAGREWDEKKDVLEKHYQEAVKRGNDFEKYFLAGPLMSCDAKVHAMDEIQTYFPELDNEHIDLLNKEVGVFTEYNPEALYEQMIESYAIAYVAKTGNALKNAWNDLDAAKKAFEEHAAQRPDLLSSVTSFGEALATWEKQRDGMLESIEKYEGLVEHDRARRSQLRGWGEQSEPAIDYAKSMVESLHPDVIVARDEAMAARWNAKQRELEQGRHVENDAGRNDSEPAPDKSVGMTR